jgi:hypothetical protein
MSGVSLSQILRYAHKLADLLNGISRISNRRLGLGLGNEIASKKTWQHGVTKN